MKVRSDIKVQLVDHFGSDRRIAESAWVENPESQRGCNSGNVEKVVRAMIKGKHGTPFEHGGLTFYVEAPIFVFREWHRHRIGWSYNEVSGRYKVFDPEFYIPPNLRKCVEPKGFKPMRPELDDFDESMDRSAMIAATTDAYSMCQTSYESMIANGVAREVARNVLPLATYSAMYATCNPRSLMHFLSLRTRDDKAAVPSYPLWEIENAARQMEQTFACLWPITWQSFVDNGRVPP